MEKYNTMFFCTLEFLLLFVGRAFSNVFRLHFPIYHSVYKKDLKLVGEDIPKIIYIHIWTVLNGNILYLVLFKV